MQPHKNIALYVHWPWCKKKCPYCDFNSHVNTEAPEKEYIEALLRDFDYQAKQIGCRTLTSIFFGGGTPSLMPPETVKCIINHVSKHFELHPDIEITLEANPTSSGLEKFAEFKEFGINRLSIGIQSLHDHHLRFLGREHSTSEALKTIDAAKKVFKNINADFIYGLPEQNLETWKKDLEQIINLDLSHISCYQLTIEPQTIFHKQVLSGQWEPITTDAQADFFNLTRETFVSHKYENYETSNFSLKSMHCKHNAHIWQYGDYIGIGAGAHGRWKNLQNEHFCIKNFKMPKSYIQHAQNDEHAMVEQEPTTANERNIERLLLGLRLKTGISVDTFELNKDFSLDHAKFCNLQKMGLIKIENGFLFLTKQGWPYLDTILENLV